MERGVYGSIARVCFSSLVHSKWLGRGLDSDRVDPCLIGGGGGGPYGLRALPPPGLSCYDAASLHGRSLHDLYHHPAASAAAAAATPQCGRGPRGYVTTLEMRRGGGPGYPGGSQPTLLGDAWATPCPVHGLYGRAHHVYDTPLLDDDAAAAAITSPFYHELDGPTLDPDGPTPPPLRPTPGDQEPISAPFSKI